MAALAGGVVFEVPVSDLVPVLEGAVFGQGPPGDALRPDPAAPTASVGAVAKELCAFAVLDYGH